MLFCVKIYLVKVFYIRVEIPALCFCIGGINAKKNIAQTVEEIAEPIVEELVASWLLILLRKEATGSKSIYR